MTIGLICLGLVLLLAFELAVVPLFILMGNVLARTGISEDLFRAANAFLGGVRGGLALRLASATIAAGGTLGILIPPSIILMVYGILTQQNIGELFIAGVLPGLLGLAMYMAVIYAIAVLKPEHAPRGERATAQERWASLAGVWPFVTLFLLIIGGLYMGWFTATEAGGIGAGLALLIATVQRRMGWSRFATVMKETAYTSVMLYVVLFGAMLFSQFISFSGLADELLGLVNGSGLSRMGILLAILAVFLLLGCVMDAMAIILIFVPLFLPTLVAQEFDLVWFGIIVVVLTEIGLITPPVGMNVFVLKANLPKVPVGAIFRGLLPFVGVDVLRLAVLVGFPSISLVLLQLMK
ncbi:MAG: TRAP transporter large permease [Hydrogenophaga sp.]|nr:TRAP transporter large permease [Hydrogenophaga sp.]